MRVPRQIGQQMAKHAIDQPRRATAAFGNLLKRDFKFVQTVVPGLVDPRRLARRADERSAEQIRQRRMVVPIGQQRAEQVGAAEKRAVGRRRAAKHDVIAAAGAGVPAVEHEFFGAEPRLPGIFVQAGRVLHQLIPTVSRMDIDFDHARIGSDFDMVQAIIVRRRISFDHDGQRQFGRRRFDRRDQRQIILQANDRRHEHMQPAFARFDAQRGADHPLGRLPDGRQWRRDAASA